MVERFDFLSPSFRADPYPRYAAMRRSSPVCQVDPGGMWAVSRWEDVLFVLKHPGIFSSQGFKAAWEPPWVGYNPLAHSMLALDPPAHTRLRGLVARAFGAGTASRLAPKVERLAEELASRLVGEIDFVDAFANPLPAFVIGEILGLDPALHVHFRRWADDILSVALEPRSEEHAAQVRTTIAELCRYLREVVAARRCEPADDTVSELIRAEVEGQSLTEQEIVDFLVVLLLGGLETTTHLLGSTMILLAEQPALWDRLRREPALAAPFVEEMLRYDGPSHSLPRITTAEVTLAGVTIPPGSLVLALLGSANRDERRYAEPDRFDIERGSQGGLQFGHGVHFCIGALLARMEARIALEVLTRRFCRVELGADEIRYNRTLTVRGPLSLLLRFS
ncbi:cytochrome P450 [Polyangium jinanense]|uniref:Cytochrome P450 n=1 Tax=Polyangium jinanense TaxID=2829994 RepID=A0A9X3X979_9BACT|nr:cytochrome P450 [Polyangium jinanense]MDC3959883.1 cytochrome P450 [Polyangium jinanense]MDC3986334.1 cytochrome P450 [Polyangium jinanense]